MISNQKHYIIRNTINVDYKKSFIKTLSISLKKYQSLVIFNKVYKVSLTKC